MTDIKLKLGIVFKQNASTLASALKNSHFYEWTRKMKIKIASMLLREDVRAILNKIQTCKNDALYFKSQLKNLLQRKQKLDQQLSDLNQEKESIDRIIVTLRNEVEEKRLLRNVAEQIVLIEKDIKNIEKEVSDCSLSIGELQKFITQLQQEISNLKMRKLKLEEEKKQYGNGADEEDKISRELQNINSNIISLQNWLLTHSGELTQIEGVITELIKLFEEKEDSDVQPLEGEEEDEEDEIKITRGGEEPDEGKSKDIVEPRTRRKRDHKIKEVFDIKTGKTFYADIFFKRPVAELEIWRTIFQQCISQGNRRFVCPKCLEMIRISGRGDERGVPAIFTHKNDSVSCKRTTTGQSIEDINRKKYGLFGQSQRHKDLKKELYNCLCDTDSLSLGVRNVEMEKRVYSTLPFFSWRQPDVQIEYEGHKIVFEIQLSTTFLSVITERDTFYRLNDYYLIWIFNFDNNRKYVDLNNLAMKDIYFANKRNAFIFDDEAREWSRESGQLVLKCNWVEPDSTWHYANTEKRFGGERVTLDMLKFDNDTHKLYYYDAETPYFEKHPDIANRLITEQKTRENYIKELELRAQEKEIRKQEAIEQMMRDGGHVIPFEEKGHYGFKYGVTTIIEPHFTSFVPLEDGSFIVGFNKKEGLVSQYGEMIRDCEYKRIHPLSGNAYVAEDKTNYWLCNLNIPICKHSPNDCVMHRMINERVEQVDIHNNAQNDSSFCCYIIDGNNLFVKNDNKDIVFVDYEGNKIVDEEFNEIEFLPNHVICLQRKKDNLWNNMDYEGFFLHEWTKYMSFEPWSNGLRIGKYSNCYHQDLYDIIDVNSNVISGGFSSIGQLIDGKAKVSLDAFSGEVDESGEILPERSVSFSNGYQVVKKLGYWELLNNLGNRILGLSEKIEFVNQLDDSIFVIQKRGLRGLADSTGMILPCKYESIELWSSEILKIGSHNIQFLTDKMGKCQISQKYNKIGKLEDGKAKVSLHGQEAYINSIGKLIRDCRLILLV